MTAETSAIYTEIKLEAKKRVPRLKPAAALPVVLALISLIPSARAQASDYRLAIQDALRQKHAPTNFGCFDIEAPGIFYAPGSQELESGEILTLRGMTQTSRFKTRIGAVTSGGKVDATVGAYQEPAGPERATVCPKGH